MNTKSLLSLLALSLCLSTGRGADFEQAVTDLIPGLANPDVPARYAAQMQLQDIASQSSKPGNEADRAALGKVLTAKAADASVPQPARVWIVRQLEYMGSGEAVPALTQLLNGSDAELRECARRALEKNGDPAAGVPLRAALEEGGDSAWKVGLISSLGQRSDDAAAGPIARHLSDAATAAAAANALSRIPNQIAFDALAGARPTPMVAQARIEQANRLLARGDLGTALEIYRTLYSSADVAGFASVRAAALAGWAKTDPARASEAITQAATGNDALLQRAAIAAAASTPGTAQLLVGLLPQLPNPAKAQALNLLTALVAEPQVIRAVADADEGVRRAALEALGRLGSAASVPVLLAAATDNVKPGKSTAVAALARVKGDGAAAAIREAAGTGDTKLRAAAITALAARGDASAIPAILRYTGDADSTVKGAAFTALGKMGTESELAPLARLAIAGKSQDAAAALEAIASRASDKSVAAKQLLSAAGTDEQALASMLDAMSTLGGDEALTAVSKLASSSNDPVRDDAIRALGSWSDFAAVKPLLAIAANTDAKLGQYSLAMQAIARLVQSSEKEAADPRVEAVKDALAAARRDDERKLLLSALAAVPSGKGAALIKPLLSDPNLKAEAGAAGVKLAEAIRRSDRATARNLAQAVKDANISSSLNERADRLLSR